MSIIKNIFHRIFAEGIFNLILLLMSIFLLMQVAGYAPMARAFPRLVLVMILLLVIMDFVRGFLKPRKPDIADAGQSGESEESRATGHEGESVDKVQPTSKALVCAVFLLMFVFLAFMYLLGFILGSFIFVLASSWALGYRHIKRLILSSIAVTCFLYIIFILIMSSRLPRGLIMEHILR